MPAESVSELRALDVVISDLYDKGREAWDQADTITPLLSDELTSDLNSVRFPFIYPIAFGRETIEGEPPPFQSLVGTHVDIELKRYSGGIKEKRENLASSWVRNHVLRLSSALAQVVGDAIRREIFRALNDGDSDAEFTMYDGDLLFSTTHTVGFPGTSWSNLLTGTGTTAAAVATDIQSARTQFGRIPWGPNGQFMPIGGAQFLVLAPVELERVFLEVISNTMKPEGTFNTENVWRGIAELSLWNELDDVDDWYMAMLLPGAKPFVHLRHSTEGGRALRTDVDFGGTADKRGDAEWWVRTVERVFPTQFWQLLKVTN